MLVGIIELVRDTLGMGIISACGAARGLPWPDIDVLDAEGDNE